MNLFFNREDRLKLVTVSCEKCGTAFDEAMGVAVWKSRHPSKALLCIECDPEALKPALVRVTRKGQALKV